MARLRVVLVYAGSILFFLLLIPGALSLGGVFLDRQLRWLSLPQKWILRPLGGLSILAGLSFVRSGWLALLRFGKGHPQEAFGWALLPPPQRLVIDGPFAFTRHPMALGLMLYLLGTILILGSPGGLFLLYPIFCLSIILYLKLIEEPSLIRRFGEEYLIYRGRVSFLLPRVPD
jgi:protein-S-isoprenylcysteine O-methyltransferase Ste14